MQNSLRSKESDLATKTDTIQKLNKSIEEHLVAINNLKNEKQLLSDKSEEVQNSLRSKESDLATKSDTIQKLNKSIEEYLVAINNLKNEKQLLSDKSEILQALVVKFEAEADSWKAKSAELKLQVLCYFLR